MQVFGLNNITHIAGGGRHALAIIGGLPSPPVGLIPTPWASQVSLRWSPVPRVNSYNIYWATYSGVSKTNYEGVITGITTNSYTITGLLSGTTYYFIVTAVNPQGEGPASVVVSATPQ